MIKAEIVRITKAFGYSFEGLKAAFVSEPAFRYELLAFAIVFPAAFLFDVTSGERAVMIASSFLVLIIEIINSSVEAAVDRISPERHELSKKAKDMGSAAVLLAIINAFVVWGIILLG